ncbi:MAG: YkgJ family cysteine cluster protein [Firmicutes bacterium]|nr:YkgJ family cysteine cluster protein [Bacillota bacterium]
MGNSKVEAFLITLEEHQLGHDLRLTSDDATIGDMLEALSDFAEKHLYKCLGCDGCCYERAPLTILDIPALATLLPAGKFPAHMVCQAFAEVYIDQDGIIDIALRRDEQGACLFLDKERKCCRHWQSRPFVCRSHFCLPRSNRLEALRQDIVNNGENELIRVLLCEQADGATPLILPSIDIINYPPDQAYLSQEWQRIKVKSLVSSKFWRKLR